MQKKKKKKNQKMFFVSESKLSLLRRECLLSAVIGLTNIPQILYITQRDCFNLNCLHSDQ